MSDTSIDFAEVVNYEKEKTIEILHPKTEIPLGWTVTLRSAGSAKARKVFREQQRDRLERMQRGKLILDVEKMEDQEFARIASCIDNWNPGNHNYNGEKPENTIKWYVKVLTEQQWFFNQVKEACEDVGNFLGNSGTNS